VDAAGCARARFFIDVVNEKYAKLQVAHYRRQDLTLTRLSPGVEAIQTLLPSDKLFALDSDLSAADASIAPWLLSLGVLDTSASAPLLGATIVLGCGTVYQDVKEHPSVKSTYDAVRVTDR
jgi:hypothetical protein